MARPTQLVLSSSEMRALIELIDKRVSDARFAKALPEDENLDDYRLTKKDFQALADRFRKIMQDAATSWAEFIVLPVAHTRKEYNDDIARAEHSAREEAKSQRK